MAVAASGKAAICLDQLGCGDNKKQTIQRETTNNKHWAVCLGQKYSSLEAKMLSGRYEKIINKSRMIDGEGMQ